MSWTRTLVVATAAPFAVILYLVASTGNPRSATVAIERWAANSGTATPQDGAVFHAVDRVPILLRCFPPAESGNLSELTLDLFVRDPTPLRVHVFSQRTALSEPVAALDLSHEIRRTGWNEGIRVSFDESSALQGAGVVGLSIAAPGPNVIGIRNARLSAPSYGERLSALLSRILTPGPLTPRSINFVEGSRIAGRGVLFIPWAAFGLAALALAVRRLLLRERFPIAAHLGLTATVLCAVADLRNTVDYAEHVRSAAARARAAGGDVVEYLALQEGDHYPWLAPAVDLLAREVGGGTYFLGVPGVPGGAEAASRAAYYARPARRAESPEEAEVALVGAEAAARLEKSPQWERMPDLPGGLKVLRRRS